MMKGMAKLGIRLAIFAGLACASLAIVYAFTKDSIDRQNELQLQASLKEIFPQAVSFDPLQDLTSSDPNIKFQAVYEVKSELAPLGIAVKAVGPSYGGPATLLVGVDLMRTITGVRVMALSDTPGLGMNATNPTYYVEKTKKITFLGQFTNKALTDPFQVKNDVVAITAATISSRSLTNIIKAAGDAAIAYMNQKAITTPTGGSGQPQDASTGNAAQPQAGGK